MEKSSYLKIRESQIDIESRDENLINKEKVLSELIFEHNEKFEKLRKGYIKLGLINELQSSSEEPMIRIKFQKELKILETRYEQINKDPKTKEEKLKSQHEREQYISDSISLSSKRWYTIIAYKNLWRKERYEFREKEQELEKDYITLDKFDEKTNQSKWIELAEKLFSKHIILIEEQNKRLLGEEELQNELESIFKYREQLFKLAEELFVI